ncbi:MAG: DNA-binding protein [Aeromicrobium sp.]|jgi:hemolysin III|nr:DNA-binding protein [Aeromicrobium sp.]
MGPVASVGALVYGIKRPDPSPPHFGFHEVFHSLTVAAFTIHSIGIGLLVQS